LKRESRRAVLYVGSIAVICVFRGEVLEHVFFGRTKEEVFQAFESSSVKGESPSFSEDPELLEQCKVVAIGVEDKAKRIKRAR